MYNLTGTILPSLYAVTDVYLPLSYTPINPSLEPRVLSKVGTVYQSLELGQEFRLTNTVFPGIYIDRAMVVGFCQDGVLVQISDSDIRKWAEDWFFSSHSKDDYRQLFEQEYHLLYTEEAGLLSERVIGYQ